MNKSAIALTKCVRYGNNEASFYVNERMELVRKDGVLAFMGYSNQHGPRGQFSYDGLFTTAGYGFGGDASEWTPVTDLEGAEHVVREWQDCGWLLVTPS